MSRRRFLRAFLRDRRGIGALAPSSPALASLMLDWLDWDSLETVVEFGPGTGVFTEAVGRRVKPGTTFFAIERDPELAGITRQRCPGISVFEDCVTRVPELCHEAGVTRVDAIVAGLPWASFPEPLQERCLDAMFEVLQPGGRFATFAYWQGLSLPGGRRFRGLLDEHFETVQRSPTAWRNLPPAFAYRCVR